MCAPGIAPDACDWSTENNGKGRFNPQVKRWFKSRNEIIEVAKREGREYHVS